MADSDQPPVPPDLAAALEQLAGPAGAAGADPDVAGKLEYLIDALIMRGQLPKSFRRVIARIHGDRGERVRLAIWPDKYAVEGPDIDCAARIPLCGARCCTYDVVLSAQDVAERSLPFVTERPYELPRDPVTKKCVCMDAAGACTVYAHRPGTCRAYDCREDRRVWLDFEARIPAPR